MATINLAVPLGTDEKGKVHSIDFSTHRHLLMGGSTGSGKSVFNHHAIRTLIKQNSPEQVRFLLCDPKVVELTVYNKGPYFLTETLTRPVDIFSYLEKLVGEINNNQFDLFIIIDTISDLMMNDSALFEKLAEELAQKSKFHLIMCDSRIGKDVFSSSLLKLFPTRIAFNVPDSEASNLLINNAGAENLKGKGDMLFIENLNSTPVRLQGQSVSEKEVLDFVKELGG